ncbi:sugar phosphate isomerase/epimerase family protein [Lacticaseibacillus hegangensis]|uniref:Sugar phosphate isomerase/epimerase family protein n=1 Tax=Lacticaseibacillus hegangensis TaxID=2486010 RepID=A0ABW4CU13_9LACO|nr:TIM barrel protein [Lacticaseibacillus hegangensis]
MQVATEIYSIYDLYQHDPEKAMAWLNTIGCHYVELYGDPILDVDELKNLLNRYQIRLVSWQVEWKYLQPQNINYTLAYHSALGTPQIFIPALGGPWQVGHTIAENTADTWKAHASRITTLIPQFRRRGIKFGYHTHDYDFGEKLDNNQTSLEILINHTPPDFQFELDTGNAIEGGKLPQDLLVQLKGRVDICHVKPFSKQYRYDVRIGDSTDASDWPSIIDAAELAGTKFLVCETEAQKLGPTTDVAKADFDTMTTIIARD